MAKNIKYKYDITLSYIFNKKITEIPTESISQVIISYDYERTFSPIAYIRLNLKTNLYNKMIIHSNKGRLLFTVKKFRSNRPESKKVYIKKSMNYFFNKQDLAYTMKNEPEDESYRDCTIGLLDLDIVNDNKNKVINNVFKNTNTMSIIHYYLPKNNKVIIEKFDNNPDHDVMVIPPMTGIFNLLKYLNQMSSFYSTGYRYFRDFNRTYILSRKGKGIPVGKQYKSVHINVDTKEDASSRGLVEDKKNKCYIIDVNRVEMKLETNSVQDSMFNFYIGVDKDGSTTKESINVDKASNSKRKPKIIRIYNDNSKYVSSAVNDVESTDSILTVNKTDIDAGIIAPHKEFIVQNDTRLKVKNGKYNLVGKREVYTRDGSFFICATNITLKKVKK